MSAESRCCAVCQQDLPLDRFPVNLSAKEGRLSTCDRCQSEETASKERSRRTEAVFDWNRALKATFPERRWRLEQEERSLNYPMRGPRERAG